MTTSINGPSTYVKPCGACGEPDCPDCGPYQLRPSMQIRPSAPPSRADNPDLVILTKHEDEVAHDRSFADGYGVGFPDGYRAAVADIMAGRGLKYRPVE